MANHAPKLAESGNVSRDMLDLLPGQPLHIKAKELHLGRKLELFDKNGKFIAAIRKNLPGNTPAERCYTLEYEGGYKALIPVPYFCSTSSFLIEVKPNEDLTISLPSQSEERHYRLAEMGLDDVSSVRPAVVEKKELSPKWQEIPLKDDQYLAFEAEDAVLARLYKVPHCDEYILRGTDGEALKHYKEGSSDELGASSGKKLFFEVKGGKFRVKGEMKFQLKILAVGKPKRIEADRDEAFDFDHPHILNGVINGGRAIALASYREVGAVKDGLLHRNEDSIGFNNDTAVAADGLGGHYHGALASDHAVETLLNQKTGFKEAVNNTHERMVMFTHYYRDLVQRKQEGEPVELADEWFQLPADDPDRKTGKKNAKEISVPDSVMAAVRFEGDTMKTMVLGDCRIFVVRGSEVVYRSRRHTIVEAMVERGQMTRREALTSPMSSTVSTTLTGSFAPDYDEFRLQKGDRIVVLSDGLELPEEFLVECVKDRSAEQALMNIIKEKRDENLGYGGYHDLKDGGPLISARSLDNASGAVIVHD